MEKEKGKYPKSIRGGGIYFGNHHKGLEFSSLPGSVWKTIWVYLNLSLKYLNKHETPGSSAMALSNYKT